MDFSQKKLSIEAAAELRKCSIRTVSPFAPMLAPVYVFMKRNEKFVSVKAPLDFFTPVELEKLHPLEMFFLPSSVDASLPIRDSARGIRRLLEWKVPEGLVNAPLLPPAPYEISDAILRVLARIWGPKMKVRPFQIAVFGNELCDLLPGDLLMRTREKSVDLYESALIQSGWAVFLALHVGHCDLRFLGLLRQQIFSRMLDGEGTRPKIRNAPAVDELIEGVFRKPMDLRSGSMDARGLEHEQGAFFLKIARKLRRIREVLAQQALSTEELQADAGLGEEGLGA